MFKVESSTLPHRVNKSQKTADYSYKEDFDDGDQWTSLADLGGYDIDIDEYTKEYNSDHLLSISTQNILYSYSTSPHKKGFGQNSKVRNSSYYEVVENSKKGYLYKYSVGRGRYTMKNWRRRFFTVDHNGLNYSKKERAKPSSRTYIPFTVCTRPELTLAPVFLLPAVNTNLHSAATDEDAFYFGVHFEENQKSYILLLKAQSAIEREAWVRFMAQFLHWGVLDNGGIPRHPPTHGSAYDTDDPEKLPFKDRLALRDTILEWKEGYQEYRHQNTKVLAIFNGRHPLYMSDDARSVLSVYQEPKSTKAYTRKITPYTSDWDDLDEYDSLEESIDDTDL